MLEQYFNKPEEETDSAIDAPKGDWEYVEGIPDTEVSDDLDINELMDHANIAEILSEELLSKLAISVVETYEMDKGSRSHREKSMDEAMNLALQITEEKTFPWTGASSVAFPVITEAAITFAARAYPAIIRGDTIVIGKVIGSDKGIPQPLINPMTGMPPIDPQTGQILIDPSTGQPPMQIVGAGEKKKRADRVANYMNYQLLEEIEGWEEDTDKLLTALPITGNMFRKIYYNAELGRPECCLVYPRHLVVNYKAKSLARAPRITEEVELYPHEIIERIRSGTFIDFEFDAAQSQDEDLSDREREITLSSDWHNPHLFLQQYRKIDLDGDGYPEPYIVTVHKDKGAVVRIKANYHKDGIKRNKKGQIAKIKCEEYYIKYGFIPSPDGSFYDLGWGELLLSLSKTINATLNKLMDAGTLATTSQGFLARGVKVKGGESRFRPGEFKTADTRGMALKDSFVQIQHPEPSMVMFQLLGMLVDSAKSLGSLRDVLSGEQIANQSGIAALSLIDQGLTGFKSIYKRVRRSLDQEVKLLYRVNALYMDEEHYYNIMDNEQAIGRKDFEQEGVDIMPAADASIVTDMQRLAKAQFYMEFRQDPYIDQSKLHEKIFEYVGEDHEGLIVQPPAPPEDPNLALVKGQIQVEQYKAQIKEQEMTHKAQEQASNAQIKQQEFTLKVQIENQKAQNQALQSQLKMQEQEFKLRSLAQETAINEQISTREAQLKEAKTNAEMQKLGMQAMEILSKVELSKQQMQLDLFDRHNDRMDKEQSKLKESSELEAIKQVVQGMADNRGQDIQIVIQPLIEAMSRMEKKEEPAHSQDMACMMEPIAEAIRSLKEAPVEKKTKRFKATRNKDGSLEGEIITEDAGESEDVGEIEEDGISE